MTKLLDMADIQGNIIRAYGRFHFSKARDVLLRIDDGDSGREFVGEVTKQVTTSVKWKTDKAPDGAIPKPRSTVNIAFTFGGLKALGVPTSSLSGFPEEFIMGMQARKGILGDDGPSAPEHWDPVWHERVHVLLSINGQSQDDVEARYRWVQGLIDASRSGVVLLPGHRGEGGRELAYQDSSVLYENGHPVPKEHFGYTDGISDPVFEGQPGNAYRTRGRGKLTDTGGWAPLETGEFLLGHPDEAMEYPAAPMPALLSRNGTFMAYRKLHENVGKFEGLLDEHAKTFPGGKELLAAKFAGRWRDNGAPIVHAPDAAKKADWDKRFAAAGREERDAMLSDFNYDDDLQGAKCPLSGHLRRINPRGSLRFDLKQKSRPDNKGVYEIGPYDTPGALDNRRRILRRGLPYGEAKDRYSNDGNHGIVFMALGASIKRQFEFVQQQWINYGNDFKESNDKEVLLGNHSTGCPGKMVIQADPNSGKPPYFVADLPRLVETRGGEYFFVPSMTALRMIAKGIVDPT